MPQIKVNVNEFVTVAKKFSNAADSCTKIQEKLKNVTDDVLAANWNGKSKTEFINEFKTLYKNMYNYRDILLCISKDLTDVASRFNETDTTLGNMILKDGTQK